MTRWAVPLLLALLSTGCATLFAPVEPRALHPDGPTASLVHLFAADPDQPELRRSIGTGFLVDGRGIVATAAHVVEDPLPLIDARVEGRAGQGDHFTPAAVITRDPDRDVALIQIDMQRLRAPLAPVRFAREHTPTLGQPVVIYGYPEADLVGMQLRRSSGAVSSMRDNPLSHAPGITPMIELEARIEPGNSGSPVFNDGDALVGIVSSRWRSTEAYALATPAAVIQELLLQRYDADHHALQSQLKAASPRLADALHNAQNLAASMQGVFPPESEGARRVERLTAHLNAAAERLAPLDDALQSGAWATADRHRALIKHTLTDHAADLQMLTAARDALRAQIDER